MRGVILLAVVAISTAAAAQLPDAKLQKLFEKNKSLLQRVDVHTPLLQPRSNTSGILILKEDHMPCVVPDVTAIAVMPNALPQLQIPAVAAIPNPVLKLDMQRSKIVQAPDAK